jgi:hypothetical protein
VGHLAACFADTVSMPGHLCRPTLFQEIDMGLFNWLSGGFFGDDSPACSVNPASGLPMTGGCGGIDLQGNPYGTDLHTYEVNSSPFDDGFSSNIDSTEFDSCSDFSWD